MPAPALAKEYSDEAGQDTPADEGMSDEDLDARLDSLGIAIAQKRAEFIDGRRACGIEKEWNLDDESFHGVDDFNRGSDSTTYGQKPFGQMALGDTEGDDEYGATSKAYINITKPYCQAFSARCTDMLQPTDEAAWHLGPTPIPSLAALADGMLTKDLKRQIEQEHPGATPELIEQKRQQLVAFAKEQTEEARKKAELAQTQIEDWLVECQYTSHIRRMMDDVSRIGTGVIKGPVSQAVKAVAFIKGQIVIQEDIKPVSKRVDPRNCYPDPYCGEDIQNGSGHFEREEVSKGEVLKLLDQPEEAGWIKDQIKAALKEGPHRATGSWVSGDDVPNFLTSLEKSNRQNVFEFWYYFGILEPEDMMAAGVEVDKELEFEYVHAEIIMLNNRVIKANLNELDTGEFPYDYMRCEVRRGMPWGKSLAADLREPQRILNQATRAMMDNAGRAGGPQVITSDRLFPRNGRREITPWKQWGISDDEELEHLDNAMTFIDVEMYQDKFMNIIEFAIAMAEKVSGMPMIMQGQTGDTSPETYKGLALQNDNASTVLRRVARNFDDDVTERHIRRYYRYLLQYGDDDKKGDFVVDARGSIYLVERELQSQALMQMGALFQNPVYGKDPKKYADQLLRARRLKPEDYDYDDEEWQQIVENLSKPPPDSAVEVANIRAQVTQAVATMQEESKRMLGQMKEQGTDRRQLSQQEFEVAMNSLDQDVIAFTEGKVDSRELAKIKAKLAETRMTLQAQYDLSGTQPAAPKVEPAGKAPEGKAFAA